MSEYLWKNLRAGLYGGVDVVGFKEAPASGQTLTCFIANFPTEEQAKEEYPDAKGYVAKWTGPHGARLAA